MPVFCDEGRRLLQRSDARRCSPDPKRAAASRPDWPSACRASTIIRAASKTDRGRPRYILLAGLLSGTFQAPRSRGHAVGRARARPVRDEPLSRLACLRQFREGLPLKRDTPFLSVVLAGTSRAGLQTVDIRFRVDQQPYITCAVAISYQTTPDEYQQHLFSIRSDKCLISLFKESYLHVRIFCRLFHVATESAGFVFRIKCWLFSSPTNRMNYIYKNR